MATKSWWPPIDLWDSIVKQSFWHDRSEALYNHRLQELKNGTAFPLTSTQWRSRIRSNSVVRRAVINYTSLAKAFLKERNIIM